MFARGQAALEVMIGVGIILFILSVVLVLIVEREDFLAGFDSEWQLDLECQRFSNAVYKVLSSPRGMQVSYELLDVNLLVRSDARGLEARRGDEFSTCALPTNNVVNTANSKSFTIPELTTVSVQHVDRRVVVSFV